MSETSKSYKTLEELNKLNVSGVTEESGVDSSNRYIKVFPGKVDYITVDGICNGQSKQSSNSVTNINTAAITVANIGSGYVSSVFRIGETVAINGPGGFITLGIPSSGKVGDGKSYMYMDGSGIWGYAGGNELPWFIACYSEAPMLFGTETVAGGDFRIGSASTYLYWKQSANTLYLSGTLDIAGDVVSKNWNPDWLTSPPMTGYKLEYTTGNGYFGGALISGSSTIGGRSATIIGSAIGPTGNFLNDVINPSINTKDGYILRLFDVKNTTQSNSGFRAGTLTWNNSGDITAGTGIAMTPFGLVGAVTINGVTTKTFSVSALDGSATFAGSLIAASGTFGTITAGSLGGELTVGGRLATTIGGSINSSGQFTNHVVNNSLNTSSGKILGTFSVDKTTNNNVGFRAGTLTWDADGNRLGGHGVAMTPKGLIGFNSAGNPTFSIDADTGEASFRGEITSGSTTDFIKIDGINSFIGLYQNATLRGAISINNEKDFGLNFGYNTGGSSDVYSISLCSPGFALWGSANQGNIRAGAFEINNITGTIPEGVCGIYLSHIDGVKIKCNAESGFITFVSGVGPTSEVLISYYKVAGTKMGLYMNESFGISLGGEYRTTWPSGGASTLSSLSIDSNKDWGGYTITNIYQIACTNTIGASIFTASNSINLGGVNRTTWPDAMSKISIDTHKNWGGYKITNLGAPTNPSDAATAEYVTTAVSAVTSWVTSQNYATESYVQNYVAVQRNLIKAWVTANFVAK